MSLLIRSIGTVAPQHEILQEHAAVLAARFSCESAEQERSLKALYRRTGVRKRGSVVLDSSSNGHMATQSFYGETSADHGPSTGQRMQRYHSHAGDLALRAASSAVESSGIAPALITHLITVSCSGFAAPGVDFELIGRLELHSDVLRTHVGFMGCHAAINGLRIAQAFAESGKDAVVLLCAVELCSLHQQYGWQPDRVVSNALFADGAAAVVATASSEPSPQEWTLVATGSTVIPDTADLMSWHIGDHGFEMTLSSQVPTVILQTLQPWLSNWLGKHDLLIEEICSWAVHPGGPRILDACAQAINLNRDALDDSLAVLAEHGNMSSPTVLFILERMRQRGAQLPCVVLAFGPGLAIEAALIR